MNKLHKFTCPCCKKKHKFWSESPRDNYDGLCGDCEMEIFGDPDEDEPYDFNQG